MPRMVTRAHTLMWRSMHAFHRFHAVDGLIGTRLSMKANGISGAPQSCVPAQSSWGSGVMDTSSEARVYRCRTLARLESKSITLDVEEGACLLHALAVV